MRRRARWHLPCALLLFGCGAPPAPKPVAKPVPVATVRPPLLDHVPSAGLRWLVVGRPAGLEKRPDLASLLRELFPSARLDAFRKVTGVDLAKVRVGAIAEFQVGTLYLAELGEPLVGVTAYLGTPRFWFESFQNWQSEFVSIWAMIVLSIFLRQKGSPESKPVDAPHRQTGS